MGSGIANDLSAKKWLAINHRELLSTTTQMPIYRLHFTWKEKEYVLKAESLDLTHPYFVCIKDLVLPEESPVLITPADDEIRRTFEDVRQLMVPFQAVSLIEEFTTDPDSGKQQSTTPKGEVVVDKRFRKKT